MKLLSSIFILVFTQILGANERPDLEFRPELVQETKAWAQNAQIEIDRAFQTAKRQGIEDQEGILRRALDRTLEGSEKQNESLMRFVLYRAQTIHDILRQDENGPKKNATNRRFLREAMELAKSKYEVDQSLFQRISSEESPMRPIEFAVLGLEWLVFVLDYHYQISTNAARMEVMKQSLVIWMNDTAADAEYNRALAPVTHASADFYQSILDDDTKTNIAVLALTRKIRTFLEDEIKLAKQILSVGEAEAEDKAAVVEAEAENIGPSQYVTIWADKKTCASEYAEGRGFKDRGWKKKYCIKISSIENEYETHLNKNCIPGYADGEPFTKNDMHGKKCIRIHNGPSQYVTRWADKKTCASEYAEGRGLKDRGWTKKYCIKISSIENEYETHLNKNCIPGYAVGEPFTKNDMHGKKCIRTGNSL